jgi:hypothetical protein
MSNDTATAAPIATASGFYTVAVKGLRGRKWFDAGCGRCGDQAFVQSLCDSVAADHPELRFQVMDPKGLTYAPDKYRPWAAAYGTEKDDDVNVDELSDAEL